MSELAKKLATGLGIGFGAAAAIVIAVAAGGADLPYTVGGDEQKIDETTYNAIAVCFVTQGLTVGDYSGIDRACIDSRNGYTAAVVDETVVAPADAPPAKAKGVARGYVEAMIEAQSP